MQVATQFPGHSPCSKLYLREKHETMVLQALKFRMKHFTFCPGCAGSESLTIPHLSSPAFLGLCSHVDHLRNHGDRMAEFQNRRPW